MQLTPELLLIGAALILGLVAAVLFFARKTSKEAAALVPPDTVEHLLQTVDKLIIAALPGIAASKTGVDDDLGISYLAVRGWKVTGSPDAGYQAVLPPAKESAKLP